MKCPCCGHEMVMDGHTKVDRMMCYECGYQEGRAISTQREEKKAPQQSHEGKGFGFHMSSVLSRFEHRSA